MSFLIKKKTDKMNSFEMIIYFEGINYVRLLLIIIINQ